MTERIDTFELDGLEFRVTLSEAAAEALESATWVARAAPLLTAGPVVETTDVALASGVVTVRFAPESLGAGDYRVQVIADLGSDFHTAGAYVARVFPSLRAPA